MKKKNDIKQIARIIATDYREKDIQLILNKKGALIENWFIDSLDYYSGYLYLDLLQLYESIGHLPAKIRKSDDLLDDLDELCTELSSVGKEKINFWSTVIKDWSKKRLKLEQELEHLANSRRFYFS
jgi:hypothetical protein